MSGHTLQGRVISGYEFTILIMALIFSILSILFTGAILYHVFIGSGHVPGYYTKFLFIPVSQLILMYMRWKIIGGIYD